MGSRGRHSEHAVHRGILQISFLIEKSQNNLHAPGTVVLPESVTYCVFQCS